MIRLSRGFSPRVSWTRKLEALHLKPRKTYKPWAHLWHPTPAADTVKGGFRLRQAHLPSFVPGLMGSKYPMITSLG